jgi:hypothetical protein
LDLNLPVLQALIHPPPASNFYQKVGNRLIYVNGTYYEGPIEPIEDVYHKRSGKGGKLMLNDHIIYEGDWEDDYPIFPEEGIVISLPLRS